MTEPNLPPALAGAGASAALPALARVEARVLRAPIATPVRTSFGVMEDRPAVLVRVEDEEGAAGWGEIWCNFPACGAEHRARLAAGVLAPPLLGHAFTDPVAAGRLLARTTRVLALQTREYGPLDQCAAGIDVALWDLAARRAGQPLWRLLGGSSGRRLPVYASGINPAAAEERVPAARDAGYTAFKVKIGFGREQDLAVVRAVAGGLASGEQLMLDANQAWDVAGAQRMAAALAAFAPAWLEEPLAADAPAESWDTLAHSAPVPLAAGENIVGTQAFVDAIRRGSLQVIQPDVCKWGGISYCVPIGRRAVDAGRRYCPHYLGGGIGLVASAHALAAVGGDGLLEVDSNPNPLRAALAQPWPEVTAGVIDLPDAPGLGVRPDLEQARQWQTLHLEARA